MAKRTQPEVKEFVEKLRIRHQVGFDDNFYIVVDDKKYKPFVAYHYSSTNQVRVVYGNEFELFEKFYPKIDELEKVIMYEKSV